MEISVFSKRNRDWFGITSRSMRRTRERRRLLGSSSILMEWEQKKRIKAKKLREIGARFNVISAHVGRKHLGLAPVNRMGAALLVWWTRSSRKYYGPYPDHHPKNLLGIISDYFMRINWPAFIITIHNWLLVATAHRKNKYWEPSQTALGEIG